MSSERPQPEQAFTRQEVTSALEQAPDEPTTEEASEIHENAERDLEVLNELDRATAEDADELGVVDTQIFLRALPAIKQILTNVRTLGPEMAQASRAEAATIANQVIDRVNKQHADVAAYERIKDALEAMFPDRQELGETREDLRVQEPQEATPEVSPDVVADMEAAEVEREEAMDKALQDVQDVYDQT